MSMSMSIRISISISVSVSRDTRTHMYVDSIEPLTACTGIGCRSPCKQASAHHNLKPKSKRVCTLTKIRDTPRKDPSARLRPSTYRSATSSRHRLEFSLWGLGFKTFSILGGSV